MPGMTFSSGTTYGIRLRAAGSHPGIAAAAPAVAASLINDRLDKPSDIWMVPLAPLVMADVAVLGCSALGVAVDAKPHVDLMHRLYPFHRLDRSMTSLASEAGIDMRTMGKAYEVGQRIDPVPADLEIGLGVIGPGTGHRQQSTAFLAAMASHTALHWRHARGRGAPRILVAILAGDFVDPGVDAMAEGDGLLDVEARGPRPLRESDHAHSGGEHRERERKQCAVQIQVHLKSGKALPSLCTAGMPIR